MEKAQDKKTILVVEDEMPLIKAITKKMGVYQISVLSARSAKKAFSILKSKSIDAVWLDHYLLGKESGLDLMKWVREDKKLSKIPVFVVSNTVSPDKIETYLQLGAVRYYTKSDYGLSRIINYINFYLGKKK